MNIERTVLLNGKPARLKSDVRLWWNKLQFKAAFGHLGLLLTLMVYTTAGGIVFRALEHPEAVSRTAELNHSLVRHRLHLVATVVNARDHANLTALVAAALGQYERALQEAVSGGVRVPTAPDAAADLATGSKPADPETDSEDSAADEDWSLTKAVFFSSTVLTTIDTEIFVKLNGQYSVRCYQVVFVDESTKMLVIDMVKTCESQFSITADEIECSGSPVLYSGSSSRTNHASANGSIITMTLKNNHLIVETEERNDITEDSRETTMKYSPSLQDGVFVVEVQQGVRARDASSGPGAAAEDASVGSDQRALVHNPPERFTDDDTLEEVDEEYYAETTSPRGSSPRPLKSSSTNTGLSQSTLSMSSGDPNPSYRYGNQQGYDNGYYGYPVYNGYVNEDPLPRLPDNKPKITSAVYKQNGRLMSIDPEGGLSSDKYAKQSSIRESESDDAIQEEQRRLGNMSKDDAPAIYSQIKQTIIPANSPKFEKLQNDLSPSVETSTANGKQYENRGFEKTETGKN